MTAEAKLRSLAAADATLQGFLGTTPFRWFDTQVLQGAIASGPCVRVRRVSTVLDYVQQGLQPINQPLFQIDVLAVQPETARAVEAAIVTFLGTVDLAATNQFDSVPTTPQQFPTFIRNRRAGMEPNTTTPVYVQTIDVRLFNLED